MILVYQVGNDDAVARMQQLLNSKATVSVTIDVPRGKAALLWCRWTEVYRDLSARSVVASTPATMYEYVPASMSVTLTGKSAAVEEARAYLEVQLASFKTKKVVVDAAKRSPALVHELRKLAYQLHVQSGAADDDDRCVCVPTPLSRE